MGSRATRSHGAPLHTPKPGGTTRDRPKVGDKDPDHKPDTGRKRRPPDPRAPKKPAKKPSYPHRDYRGVDGAVEDAEKGKK